MLRSIPKNGSLSGPVPTSRPMASPTRRSVPTVVYDVDGSFNAAWISRCDHVGNATLAAHGS